jgi:hypothetical protein
MFLDDNRSLQTLVPKVIFKGMIALLVVGVLIKKFNIIDKK